MITALKTSSHWNARLAAKFFWAAPAATSGVVFFTLVSQLSILLAFFLPLKVVVLLGSEGIPHYFPPAFDSIGRDKLIIILSIATVTFYGLYLLAEKLIIIIGKSGAQTLLERGRKMVLFERQDELATNAYKRHANILAGVIFLLLAEVVMLWLYSDVAWIILGYVALTATTLLIGQVISEHFHDHLLEHLATWLDILAGIGFMLSFTYLVISFLFLSPPDLIPAIIALLLARQGFKRLPSVVSGLRRQYHQRAKLDAMFFHNSAFIPEWGRKKELFWDLLAPERRKLWVNEVLAEVCDPKPATEPTIEWWQTDVANVAVLLCRFHEHPGYFVKLFGHSRAGYALHEATLLSEPPNGLPCLEWVGASQVHGYHCHVLLAPDGLLPKPADPSAAVLAVRTAMLRVKPPRSLVNTYRRSRAFLWQRLSAQVLERLCVAVDSDADRQSLQKLQECEEEWRRQLSTLPLAFTSPDIRSSNLIVTTVGTVFLLHWGKWTMEPIGSGWPVDERSIKSLVKAYNQAGLERKDLFFCRLADLEMAALSYELERLLLLRQYSRAMRLILRIKPPAP